MGGTAKKIICGSKLINCRKVEINFILKPWKFLLLKGFALSPKGEYLPNVAIEATIINTENRNRIVTVCITFTDEIGEYALVVPVARSYVYILRVYS